ncbi:tyrosine-type recombinase/integrase [Nocardia mangyaensis]|uniref:tyrosine-type recombinase/integrase n=1 Tax=Nocardia mangyaensis TaxID=2213200 RepID=UPI001F0A7995|nr:tyrosine-type recombinase/integrase [Nocardia mangyaensis]
MLHRFRVAQKAEALALGVAWSDDRLVAVHEDGSAIRPEWYTDEFQRQAKAAGLPVIRLHDARHTAATNLLDSGASVSAAAKWLGHDPAILLRVYGHVYDEALSLPGQCCSVAPNRPPARSSADPLASSRQAQRVK